VPPEATAVVLTVTAKNRQTINNFVTVFPTGSSSVPEASNLNLPRPDEVTANLAFVRVGTEDSVDVFQFGACESIVDILGYFVPVTNATRAGRFVGLASARRALDTRPNFVGARSFTTVDVTPFVPAEAASVVINLTSLANPGGGFFSAVPHSVTREPETSSLNVFFPNDKRAAAVIVPVETVGTRRLIKIYASTTAKLIVDVTGYFTNDAAPLSQTGLFVPTNPTRVLDTRKPDPTKRMWPRWVVEQRLPSPAATAAAAAVLNVTSARTRAEGYLTVSGARLPIPETSNVNWNGPNAIVPNLAITPITVSHGFQVFNFSGGHVIADMAGYFTGQQRVASSRGTSTLRRRRSGRSGRCGSRGWVSRPVCSKATRCSSPTPATPGTGRARASWGRPRTSPCSATAPKPPGSRTATSIGCSRRRHLDRHHARRPRVHLPDGAPRPHRRPERQHPERDPVPSGHHVLDRGLHPGLRLVGVSTQPPVVRPDVAQVPPGRHRRTGELARVLTPASSALPGA
jgi:hypothetical protein